MHKSKSNQGLLAAKLDLEKAYDRVYWDFWEKTLDDFSFPARIVSLIVFCIRSSLFILWNGSKLPGFVPTRVLRQGHLISTHTYIFFIINMDILISLRVN